MMTQVANLTLIDLFAGCGGVTEGFTQAGFKVLAAVEWDAVTARTYSLNHPKVHMYCKDIRDVDPKEMMQNCNLREEELTVLSVCAPCQPFSRQTRMQRADDRTELVLEMIKFVKVLRPKFTIMENVPGLAKGYNKSILDKLISSLCDELKYKVLDPHIIDAVDYGVPQFRKRLIMLSSREDIPLNIPSATHFPLDTAIKTGKAKWETVADAFQGIHRLAAGQKSRTDSLHRARKHTPINIERLKHVPANGGSRRSLPEHLQLTCHQNKSGFNDVYGRLNKDRPANTLTTGCTNITKGRFGHPTANRAITPREAARLQTFRDTYLFSGNYDQISAQIGNAVPVKLTRLFAEYFKDLTSQ